MYMYMYIHIYYTYMEHMEHNMSININVADVNLEKKGFFYCLTNIIIQLYFKV